MMETTTNNVLNIKKPSWILNLTEGIRATFEIIKCLFFLLFYRYPKQRNNKPVLVVPGLLTSDISTYLMRRFIQKHGHTAYGWTLGRNLGNIDGLKVLSNILEQLYQTHQQKVTLIGWSLGGIYVRELAKEKPHLVDQIITMGSPFAAPDAPNHALWVYNFFNKSQKIDPVWWAQLPSPAPVRTTAIYSKFDGIVPWQACMEKIEDDTHRNVQVSGSHFGFPFNVVVLKTIITLL